MTIFRNLTVLKKNIDRNIGSSVYIKFCSTTTSSALSADYDEVAQYPLKNRISSLNVTKLAYRAWRYKMKELPTMEQKLIELNMPKFYGYKATMISDTGVYLNGNDFLKFITRTHVMKGLPEGYYSDPRVDTLLELIRPKLEELIYLHHNKLSYGSKDGHKSLEALCRFNSSFILDLNNLLLKTVQEEGVVFSPNSVDIAPRLEGFWWVGEYRERKNKERESIPNYIRRNFRTTCSPAIGVRTKLGLPEVVPLFESFDSSIEIFLTKNGPKSPSYYGFPYGYRRACIVPGFWPGVEDEHSQLFIYPRHELFKVEKFNQGKDCYNQILLENKSIIAGFTQSHSYAFYHGFTPVNEVTYPFTNQTVTTDGTKFQFSLYQMNTCSLHSARTFDNPRTNMLWMSEDLPLFESLEGESVKGLNDDVIKMLLSMYLKRGVPRDDPTPFMADYKYLMNHDAPDEYKDLFQKKHHWLMREMMNSNERPYVATWERIYKLRFKTRPQDKPVKWFQTDKVINPETRRLDEYQLPYINRYNRMNPRIKKFPRLNSEHLYRHDYQSLRNASAIFPDDEIAFKTLNVLPNSDRYRTGKSTRVWRKSKNIIKTVDPDLL